MRTLASNTILDRLIGRLSECLTPESARRVLKLRADPKLQALVDELADKCTKGTLSREEVALYESYVSFGSFVALLKSKTRGRAISA